MGHFTTNYKSDVRGKTIIRTQETAPQTTVQACISAIPDLPATIENRLGIPRKPREIHPVHVRRLETTWIMGHQRHHRLQNGILYKGKRAVGRMCWANSQDIINNAKKIIMSAVIGHDIIDLSMRGK